MEKAETMEKGAAGTLTPPATVASEGAKRRQIMEGARAVFLDQGFDAASMGEIARRAGVSKGTLYVYFDSKEALFEAIFEDESRLQAEPRQRRFHVVVEIGRAHV